MFGSHPSRVPWAQLTSADAPILRVAVRCINLGLVFAYKEVPNLNVNSVAGFGKELIEPPVEFLFAHGGFHFLKPIEGSFYQNRIHVFTKYGNIASDRFI